MLESLLILSQSPDFDYMVVGVLCFLAIAIIVTFIKISGELND